MRNTTIIPVVAALALTACWSGGGGKAGGQSGGLVDDPTLPDVISEAPACQCLLADFAVAVSATLIDADACLASAEVIEVLGGDERADVQPGDLLEAMPLPCMSREGIVPGDELFMLYAPEIVSGPDEDGNTFTTAPRVYYAPLDAPIRVDGTDRDLPADREQALEVLLDLATCRTWTMQHMEPPPDNEDEGEGDGEPAAEGPITRAPGPVDPAAQSGPIDDDQPGAPPDCGP